MSEVTQGVLAPTNHYPFSECEDQEPPLSSVFLILNRARRPLPFSLICFVSPGAAVFTQPLVNGGKTRRHVHVCLWCINKRPGELGATTTTTTAVTVSVSVGVGGGSGEDSGDVPISILHHSAMQIKLWVSVALSPFPQVRGARKQLAAGRRDLILLNANDISPFSSLVLCHYQ